ncbi:MAG TPA: ethylbenzene dehydrogenase-related protein, partial [Rhodospirillales bacterium]
MFGFVQKLSLGVAITALAAAASTPALSAPPSDWSQVPAKTVKLFYPGQSTYQWLRSPAHKRADKKVKAGDSCVSCHEGEEAEMGQKIVTGKKLEPNPVPGKQATIDLAVQAAHDNDNLYLRFQWKTKNDYPGSAYPHFRFDGKAWKSYGWPRLDEEVWKDKKPAIYEDRLTIMLDDGKVPGFKNQGCWLTCHDSMRDTQKEARKADVQAHPLLGKALKKSDVRKYLPETRTDDMATWDKTKSAEEIAKLKAAGHFVELMQWRAHRSNVANMA